MSNKQQYRRISLQKKLVDEIENFVENNPFYRSIADFVADAIRSRLEELDYSLAKTDDLEVPA